MYNDGMKFLDTDDILQLESNVDGMKIVYCWWYVNSKKNASDCRVCGKMYWKDDTRWK